MSRFIVIFILSLLLGIFINITHIQKPLSLLFTASFESSHVYLNGIPDSADYDKFSPITDIHGQIRDVVYSVKGYYFILFGKLKVMNRYIFILYS